MLTVLYSVKGGQGCSVTTGLLALSGDPNIVAVDATGDLALVLGVNDAHLVGLTEALLHDGPVGQLPIEHLPSGPDFVAVGQAELTDITDQQWHDLAERLADDDRHYIVDTGTGPARTMTAAADECLLVTRYCFLAFRATIRTRLRRDGVIGIVEPGRPLGRSDAERVIGASIVLELPYAPEISRAVDAGLLFVERLPAIARRALRQRDPAWADNSDDRTAT